MNELQKTEPPAGIQITRAGGRPLLELPPIKPKASEWLISAAVFIAMGVFESSRTTVGLRIVFLILGALVVIGFVVAWLSKRWLVVEDEFISYRVGFTPTLSTTRRVPLEDFDAVWSDEPDNDQLLIAGSRAIIVRGLTDDQGLFLVDYLRAQAPPAYWLES